jgi:hypothetical protein
MRPRLVRPWLEASMQFETIDLGELSAKDSTSSRFDGPILPSRLTADIIPLPKTRWACVTKARACALLGGMER